MPPIPAPRPSSAFALAPFAVPIVLWNPAVLPPPRPPDDWLPPPRPDELPPPGPDWPPLPPIDRRSVADRGAVDPGVSKEAPDPPTKMSLSTLATCLASP